jgi:formylglycine-generating enzyme
MNDENDKPKNQPNEDDWAMTMPHQRLDKSVEAENFSDEFAPKYNAPKQQQPPPLGEDDWAMTTPNLDIPQNQSFAPPPPPPPSSDFDKTTPNINIPQNPWEEQKPKAAPPPAASNQPADDWSMTTPNINVTKEDVNLQNEEKRDEWVMPEPTFRVSSGMTGIFEKLQIDDTPSPSMDFSVDSTGEDFSSDKTTPNFRLPEQPPENYGQSAPIIPSQPPAADSAPSPTLTPASQSVQTKKSGSKLPFIVGGLLMLFFLGTATLAAVYFLFLRKQETAATRVLPPVPEKNENISSSNPSEPSQPSSSQTTAQQPALPGEINHKGAMLFVAAGEFTMGSDAAGDDEASRPAHKVMLSAFYIDKYEVTNSEYKEFCDATGKPYPPDPDFEKDYFLKRPNSPVMGISYDDARGYAEWAGKRLPTEAEWEKAASWDEKTQTKRDFPWSNQFENGKATFNTSAPSDVGSFKGGASPYGVMDMAGNVIEWVDAFYEPYPNSTVNSPEFGGKNRVVRGGFFKAPTNEWLKTTKRSYVPPDTVSNKDKTSPIGFRCAVSADDPRLKDLLQSR